MRKTVAFGFVGTVAFDYIRDAAAVNVGKMAPHLIAYCVSGKRWSFCATELLYDARSRSRCLKD